MTSGIDSVSFGAAVTVYSIAAFSTSIVILGMLYTALKRSSYTIRVVNFIFCLLTQAGAMLLLISPIYIATNTSAGCMTWMWFLGIGFTLFLAPSVLKLYRLDRILDVTKWDVLVITNTQLLLGVGIFMLFEIILLLVWTIVNPIVLQLESLGDEQNTQVKICTGEGTSGIVFFIIQLVYSSLILFIACVLSVRIRNQKVGAVNESRETILAVYNIAIGIIVIVVLAIILNSNATSWALLISIGTSIITLLSWAAMYILKFWRIFTGNEQIFKQGEISSVTVAKSKTRLSLKSKGSERKDKSISEMDRKTSKETIDPVDE